jgi:uncharacterized zinc-type alcohol dehydrogenase-like protein
MGADEVVSSTDKLTLKNMGAKFDLLISTVNVNLDWNLFLSTIKPRGQTSFCWGCLRTY